MINFSMNREYSVDPELLKENFPDQYNTWVDTFNGSDEDFLLWLLDQHTPDELGADEEYTETVVF